MSAISCDCRSLDVASAAVIALNERDRRAISSSPSTGMRTVRSSVAATCSTAPVSRFTGSRPVRATHRPAAPAPTTPIPETSSSIQRRVDIELSISESGRATETASPIGPSCG